MEVGLEQFVKDLSELEKKVQNKILRKSLNKGGKIIVSDLKTRVKRKTGVLSKSISSVIKRKKRGGLYMQIGADNKNEAEDGKTGSRYFHLSEAQGLKKGERYQSSKRVAKIVNASVDATRNRVVEAIAQALKEGFEEQNK